MNISKPIMIMSAELRDANPRENMNRTTDLANTLTEYDIPYTEIEGVYDGRLESSFATTWTAGREDDFQRLVTMFDQECYLLIDANGMGVLKDGSGNGLEELGRFRITDQKPDGDYTDLGGVYITFGG